MPCVSGLDCVDAWLQACRLIKHQNNECWSLVVHIEDASLFDAPWLVTYNPKNVSNNNKDINDVINWVFARKLALKSPNREEFYASYMEIHDRAKRMGRLHNKWGTYFERLIRFEPKNTNQLEVVISKLNSWDRRKAAFVFHLSDPAIDSPRWMGGPCWQFGEVSWRDDDVLDLTAVYRNHDYFERALGNFISLAELLRYICQETGKTAGKIICHSVHADFGSRPSQIKRLINL